MEYKRGSKIIELILAFVLLLFMISLCLLQPSTATYAQTTTEIEQALKNALPEMNKLPIPKEIQWSLPVWSPPLGSRTGWMAEWKGTDTGLCPTGKPIGTTREITCLLYYNPAPVLNSPDDMRAKLLPVNKNYKVNNNVTGGVSEESFIWPECYTVLHFYKSPYIQASIAVVVHLKACPETTWPNVAARDKATQEIVGLAGGFTRSESERLAKIILDKLPKGEIGKSSSSGQSTTDIANVFGLILLIVVPLFILAAIGVGIFFLIRYLKRKNSKQATPVSSASVAATSVPQVPTQVYVAAETSKPVVVAAAPAAISPQTTALALCPQCGKPLLPAAEFCHYCGQRIEEKPQLPIVNKCAGCGTQLEADDLFCPKCGQRTN